MCSSDHVHDDLCVSCEVSMCIYVCLMSVSRPERYQCFGVFLCVSNEVSQAKDLLVLYLVKANKDLSSNDIMRFGLVSDKR